MAEGPAELHQRSLHASERILPSLLRVDAIGRKFKIIAIIRQWFGLDVAFPLQPVSIKDHLV